jgi:DNA-binding transcriptional ArsR family regulator
MDSLDIESLRLDPSLVGEAKPERRNRVRLRGRFLKGPIPLSWLARALSIGGGSAIGVGLVLWHLSGLKHNDRTVLLSNVEVKRLGISRQAKWRALAALENAGLITVERRGKSSPLVTIVVAAEDEAATSTSATRNRFNCAADGSGET